MHLIFSGEEPWLRYNGKITTILDFIYFSKAESPYLKLNSFLFSKKILNVELRTILKMSLEYNQLKRVSFVQIEKYIYNYLTRNLIQDLNLDYFVVKQKQRKGKNILIKTYSF